MKKLLLIVGLILIVLNTLFGLIISKYPPFNYVLVDVNLILSTALVYSFFKSSISDGYKIGLTVLFSITGLLKVIFSIAAPSYFQDNFYIVVILGLISFEAICFLTAVAMKKFS